MIADRWGVADAETKRRYSCDSYVREPVLQAWRAVTVDAPADLVWRWVGQLRLAPYSYDWIDNLGRRSPRELIGLPEPEPGERFMTVASRPMGRILSVTPGEELTGRIAGSVMTYLLVPQAGSTRLLLKIVAGRGRAFAPLLSVGDLIMARRQLLNLKTHAERPGPGQPGR